MTDSECYKRTMAEIEHLLTSLPTDIENQFRQIIGAKRWNEQKESYTVTA